MKRPNNKYQQKKRRDWYLKTNPFREHIVKGGVGKKKTEFHKK